MSLPGLRLNDLREILCRVARSLVDLSFALAIYVIICITAMLSLKDENSNKITFFWAFQFQLYFV